MLKKSPLPPSSILVVPQFQGNIGCLLTDSAPMIPQTDLCETHQCSLVSQAQSFCVCLSASVFV